MVGEGARCTDALPAIEPGLAISAAAATTAAAAAATAAARYWWRHGVGHGMEGAAAQFPAAAHHRQANSMDHGSGCSDRRQLCYLPREGGTMDWVSTHPTECTQAKVEPEAQAVE
jgi:hypothetical protein